MSDRMLTGRVLLVDDYLTELKTLCKAVNKKYPQCVVKTAQSVTEACQIIAEEDPFDVIMTDMRMSQEEDGEEGLQVVEAARDKDSLTAVIIITAHGNLPNVYKALSLGAKQYIDKNSPDSSRKRIEDIGKLLHCVTEQRAQLAIKILEKFTGKVESVDGNIAHLTIGDKGHSERYTDYDANELASKGIIVGTRFECTIKQQGGDVIMTFAPIPEHPLTIKQIQELWQDTQKEIGDYEIKDDYAITIN